MASYWSLGSYSHLEGAVLHAPVMLLALLLASTLLPLTGKDTPFLPQPWLLYQRLWKKLIYLLEAWAFLLNGRRMLHEEYKQEKQRTEGSALVKTLPMWGTGKMTCDGRFYASSAIKTLLGLILTKWDLQLEDPKAKQQFAWRSWIYPYAGTKVIVRPRE
ncbi:hypothetical protein PG985_009488 [Apiospora marii]|uniref:uncharacterized protein n=1 Tax=Apiospora marii TaxID=335849 RepID=UPI003130F7DF